VSGRIQAESTAAELLARPDLQHRYLGVGSDATVGEHTSGSTSKGRVP
jgi:branched-chain amino acid transport system ATP-binding protein